MQSEGIIPLISMIFHPKVVLYACSTLKSFSSAPFVKDEEIITENVEFSPKYTYLRCEGNSLSSSFGASWMDATNEDELFSSSSNFVLLAFETGIIASR